tara:strand:+ start:85 stop:306 length:222 start_codon:yes stop_codon:yes gene_type:complete
MEILTQWILPIMYIIIAITFAIYFYDICGDVIKDREKKLEDNGYEKYVRLPIAIMLGIFWPIVFVIAVYNSLT